ncbi:hypothetical protein VTH82DRAFT_7707 [Thermothelomyces myriococcoides]
MSGESALPINGTYSTHSRLPAETELAKEYAEERGTGGYPRHQPTNHGMLKYHCASTGIPNDFVPTIAGGSDFLYQWCFSSV